MEHVDTGYTCRKSVSQALKKRLDSDSNYFKTRYLKYHLIVFVSFVWGAINAQEGLTPPVISQIKLLLLLPPPKLWHMELIEDDKTVN